MNIEDIQDSVRIGLEVSVILRTGHQFFGILSEIRESSIILRQAPGIKIPLSADAIDCIFPSPSTAPETQTESDTVTKNNTFKQEKVGLVESNPAILTFENTQKQIINSESQYSVKVITELAKIETRFITSIEQSRLEILQPDFATPNEITSLPYSKERRELLDLWTRLKSRYDDTVKNKDHQKLKLLTEDFDNLVLSHPRISSIIHFNLGCIYSQIGQPRKSMEMFESACLKSKDPRFFYNLAAVVLDLNKAKACYALEQYFKLISPSEYKTCWYKFTELALEFGIANSFGNFFEKATNDNIAVYSRMRYRQGA
jgi:tetratricopeptide (TPR) repeat protein